MNETAQSYGQRIVYLALGGFLLATALEKWHLHRRFAHFVIGIFGKGPRRLIGAFMLASAALSMWISNVATTIIMMPVALSIIRLLDEDNPHYREFALCLLLGIAYACSIGGMGTLIGTGTNMFFAAYMEGSLGRPMGFARWMTIAVPIVLVFLPIAWILMTRVVFKVPGSPDSLKLEDIPIEKLGRWDVGSSLTVSLFFFVAFAWTFLPFIQKWAPLENLTDTGVAIIAAVLLFVIPINRQCEDFLLDWKTAVSKVPWGILLLIGGGLAMAKAVSDYGIGELLAYQLESISWVSDIVIIFSVVALMVFLTEFSSNIASVTALTPIFAAVAVSREMDPTQLIFPITIAASCAFMLPAATLPNSVIMGSGVVRSWDMARAGLILNIVAVLLISLRFAFGPGL